MTPAQIATFKADILAKAGSSFVLADQGAVSAYYNSTGTGFFWRPSVPVGEMNTAIVWSEFVALTSQVQAGYQALTQGGTVDTTSANIRSGFSTIFAGLTTLTNLTAIAKKVPTNFEALFTASNICALPGVTVTPALVAQALL
jgi:hypothetical protein